MQTSIGEGATWKFVHELCSSSQVGTGALLVTLPRVKYSSNLYMTACTRAHTHLCLGRPQWKVSGRGGPETGVTKRAICTAEDCISECRFYLASSTGLFCLLLLNVAISHYNSIHPLSVSPS